MRCLSILAPLVVAACAGTTPDAPSLLPRAIESRSDAEPATSAATVAPDPALDARIAERVAVFESAAKAFAATQAAVTTKIARAKGAAEGSDRWLDGQSALGDLQQARTASDAAMADLEGLAIDRATDGAPPYPPLSAAITAAQVELDRQLAIETQLKSPAGA